MKVLLIMPGVGRKPGEKYVSSWNMEPLALAMLAAVTPPEVEISFADDRLGPIPYDAAVDAVGINVETYTARRAYHIAGEFRRRGVPVILGGYHPTLVPEEARQHADAIVEGPAEGLWPQVLSDLREHRLAGRYRARPEAFPTGVRPQRSIYAGHRYLPVTLIEAGRGCRFTCEFCSVTQFHDHQAHGRTIEDVLADIQTAVHRDVFFVDDNIIANPERAKALFTALERTGVRWIGQASISLAADPSMLALMRRSGCRGLLVGFESLSPRTLAAMGKSWNTTARDYGESVRRIRAAGIPIYATFVFGYDTDDADAFERTLEFALEQKFFMAAFNHLVPFPGTPLYRRLQQEKRLRSDAWWLDPHFRFGDVAFHPANMSAAELAQRCYDARRAFYRFGSTVRRAWDFRSNCHDFRSAATYFWINAFSGSQMRKRQGLPLGEGFDDATLPDAGTLQDLQREETPA